VRRFINKAKIRGARASIEWAGAPAAELRNWVAARGEDETGWTLGARLDRADSFRLRQTPLLFVAPRLNYPRGLTVFPIVPGSLVLDRERGTLTAKLQQPEGR
jgi:hypothetical protein